MPATLKQVAEATQLTFQTVGHVLNPNSVRGHLYSAETRKKVIEAARQLGYRPNAAARAMSGGRQGCIGLLLSKSSIARHSSLPYELLDGIETAAAESQLSLIIGQLPDEELVRQGLVPRLLQHWAADGLLINRQEDIPQAMLDLIQSDPNPAVWINSKQDDLCVYVDDFDAGVKATEHLLSLNHTLIAYVDYAHGEEVLPLEHYSAMDRQAGYEHAMHKAGHRPRVIREPLEIPFADRPAYSSQWLRAHDRPTAVVTYGTTTAQPILYAAAGLDLAVPRDLSLVDFGEWPMTPMGVDVTTMLVPQREMGRKAVQILLDLINKSKEARGAAAQGSRGAHVIPFVFHQGATSSPPGKG